MSDSPGIYRRVQVRTWGDEKFRRLTPLAPSGQALFLYLLTGPHTAAIPGVFVIGRAAMAEALEWDQAAFDGCLAELVDQGLVVFDRASRLWLLPNAVRHNPPASPNVVRSWRAQWCLLPETPLRDEIAARIARILEGIGQSFAEAFAEVAGSALTKKPAKASGKASAKASAKSFEKTSGESLANQEAGVGTEAGTEDQPPQPPEGGDQASRSKRTRRTREAAPCIGLKAWLEGTKAKGEKAIPEDDPVFAYAERVGLPSEFMALAWAQFKHRHCVQHPDKRYSDWRRVFRNAVEGNWLKLWWLDPASNGYALTTAGLQAKRDHDGRKAA